MYRSGPCFILDITSTLLFSIPITFLTAIITASSANAHASKQGFVLLLPTDLYIQAGVGVVSLSVLILALLPAKTTSILFKNIKRPSLPEMVHLKTVTSLICFFFLLGLVVMGFIGPRDPLSNPLPLFIWTLWWIAFPVLQGLFGDLWQWVNPWSGLYRIINGQAKPFLPLPVFIGTGPGIIIFLLFSIYALADPAPDDPARLASFVGGYWLFTFTAMVIFGDKVWLSRGECFTILLRHFASLSPFSNARLGLAGFAILTPARPAVSTAIFVLLILGTGSFDGLNETFWWLGQINVNPLEFPGRSAIITETITGLLGANLLLITVFGFCVWLGLKLVRWVDRSEVTPSFPDIFSHLSLSIIPIAFGYHIAHYLTVFMVNSQYALAAATDPMARGSDFLNLGIFYVTTGFFNTRNTVEIIWLSQAAAVIIGHILAVLLAHAMAIKIFNKARSATISQIPLAAFMILYTLLGLWLLASPRGA